MTYDVHALRSREFPWTGTEDAIYLNNASTGPLPARSVRALAEFNQLRAEPYRLTYDHERDTLCRARELTARLIGASTGEIALMANTTYGINLAALALPLADGDVVLAPDREFPANVYPWMALERRGISFERIPTVDRLPDEEALLRALDRPRVKVLSLSWVSFATGYRLDLARLGAACRERGIYLVVDAMQGLGGAQLNVGEMEVDILACGGQKWLLSPWGTGFAYVREGLVQQLEPGVVGWMAMRASEDFTRLVDYEFLYHDNARRFEVNTLPVQDFAAYNASVALLLELGPAAVEAHVRSLGDLIVEWTRGRSDMRLVTPADPRRRAGIVSVAPPDPPAASARLTAARVSHSLREGAIRLSPHCYNTREEVLRALELLGAR